jgi:hypothetical protein
MSQGYMFVAIGESYVNECYNLCLTIRKQWDNRPFSIVTSKEFVQYAESLSIFDNVFPLKEEGEMWENCTSDFERYCLYPRITLNQYLVYDETINTDTDMLCQYPTDHVWSFCSNRTSPITTVGKPYDAQWHWGTIADVWKACNRHVPHVNGGFKYIRRGEMADAYYDICSQVFWKYDELGCKRWFRNSRSEEMIFAIAHAFSSIMPVDFREFPIETFDYTPDMTIPSKMQHEGSSPFELSGYPPFVHMPGKITCENYKWLFNTIMGVV